MGFSITYSAVTWTAGDVITEAKLDAMVANDQAYDSHSAEGLELTEQTTPSTPAANKIRVYAKDNGGVSDLYFLRDNGTECPVSYPAKTETLTNKTLTSPTINTPTINTPVFNQIQKRYLNSDVGQMEEKNIQRKASVTTAQTYLRVTMGNASGYGVALVDVTVGGIGNGVAETGTHQRYWVTLNNTTVTITPIGSAESTSVAASVPVLATSVSGYDAIFTIAKNASTSGFDGEIMTEVKLMEGTGCAMLVAYS